MRAGTLSVDVAPKDGKPGCFGLLVRMVGALFGAVIALGFILAFFYLVIRFIHWAWVQ